MKKPKMKAAEVTNKQICGLGLDKRAKTIPRSPTRKVGLRAASLGQMEQMWWPRSHN